MFPWSRPIEQFRIWTLHRWYVTGWLLVGLLPMVLAGRDDPLATRFWSMGLPVVLALYYVFTRVFPGHPASHPRTVVWVLILGLAAMSWLREGGASVYVATLPHFWYLARESKPAVFYSGVAAAATVLGGDAPQGLSPRVFTGSAVVTLVAYAVSVVVGHAAYRFAEQNSERVRLLGAELENTQRQLAEAHQRQGATEERERLAREIHDTLAQGFASIIALAEAARSGLETGRPAPAGSSGPAGPAPAGPARSVQQLLSIEQTARENLAEARALVGAASQSGIVPGSVARTLRRTLDRFTEDTGLATEADLPDIECDQQTRIALLRCTQESLANIRKHAGASTVGVVLTPYDYGVELEITDDGRGFVVGESRGFGLNGMRQRMAELGGELNVTSSVGDGTRVLAMIPTSGPASAMDGGREAGPRERADE